VRRRGLALDDVLLGVGVLLCLCMIGLSTVLNFRMGYRFADTPFDGYIYGGIGAAMDGFKALIPFLMTLAWRRGYRVPGLVGGLMFIVFTAMSFTAELGFASQHRMAKAAQLRVGSDRYSDLRHQLARVEVSLKQLGPQRPSAAIDEERKAILMTKAPESRQTVGDLSSTCTVTRRETREACTRWQTLGIEAATAAQAEMLERQAASIRRSLDSVKEGAGSEVSDPQAAALGRMMGWFQAAFQGDDIQVGLSVLVALVIEVGSGLGLYLVTVTLGHAPDMGKSLPPVKVLEPEPLPSPAEAVSDESSQLELVVEAPAMLTAKKKEPTEVGRYIGRYALERLEPVEGSPVTSTLLYRDYEAWCEANSYVPLLEALFFNEFNVIAKEVGIEIYQSGGNVVYRDVGLKRR
jgi:hypothetical protein